MVKENGRNCICGHNNCSDSHRHSLRSNTSNGNGKLGYQSVKLFGVNIITTNHEAQELQDQSLKKSYSVGNLVDSHADIVDVDAGYLSDGQIDRYNSRKSCKTGHERRKGKAWSEEEHRVFLAGLKKLGKGDWRGIAKKYVTTRTPTQVASHAQKYFLRLQTCSDSRKKRRASLFDISIRTTQSHNVPADSAVSTDHKTIGKLSQDGKSQGSEKNTGTTAQPQVAANQIAVQFPHLCLDDRPFTKPPPPIPHSLQYFDGSPVWRSYNIRQGTTSYDPPARSYARAPYYVELLPNNAGQLVTCIPVPHPSGIPSPRSSSLQMFHLSPPISPSAQTDPLDLQIGPPQPRNLSSEGSGAISVT